MKHQESASKQLVTGNDLSVEKTLHTLISKYLRRCESRESSTGIETIKRNTGKYGGS